MTISSFTCMSTQTDQVYDRVITMLKDTFEKRADSIESYKSEFIAHGYTNKLFELQTSIDMCNREIRHLVCLKHHLLEDAKRDATEGGFEILAKVHRPYDGLSDEKDFMTYVDLCKEYERSTAYEK